MAASESAHAASEIACVETAAMKTATSSAERRGWGGFTDREGARKGRENDRFCDAVHETLPARNGGCLCAVQLRPRAKAKSCAVFSLFVHAFHRLYSPAGLG